MVQVLYSPRFTRAYEKLHPELKRLVVDKIKLFEQNPFDSRLKTHKLSGGLKGSLAFSVDYRMRIIFWFDEKNAQIVYFDSIGDHSLYNKI